jgi:hypothetical protein
MFLCKERRTLDYNFLLWRFDTSKLDHASLQKLDAGAAAAENPDEKIIETKRSCL